MSAPPDEEHQWNDDDDDDELPPPPPPKQRNICGSKWAWACVALVIAIVVIVPLTVKSVQKENERKAALNAAGQLYSPAWSPAMAPAAVLDGDMTPSMSAGDMTPSMSAGDMTPSISETSVPETQVPTLPPTPVTCAFETELVCPSNTTTNSSADWNQVANDIVGEAVGDLSGFQISLSCDGSMLAVGAGHNGGNGDRAGHVRVFRLVNSTTWEQFGADIEGEASLDWFGHSVSLAANGLRMAVGARFNDGQGGNNTGHVRVFDYTEGGNWTQIGQDLDGEADGDQAGRAVSISADGTRVAVGATGNDGSGFDAGHVRVYELAEGSWTQLGLDLNGEASLDRFGRAVALSADGTKVVIGAYTNDGSATDAGHVRIYEFDAGNWTQLGDDIDGNEEGDWSGLTVSISYDGNRVAVGAPGNNERSAPGSSRVYEFNGTVWEQLGEALNGGYAVSLSEDGNRVAAGDYKGNTTGTNSGHVNVFEYDGSDWVLLGSEISGVAGELSGTSVSLTANGDRVAISSPVYGDEAGVTRVYDLC